jgi:hypothetical protein
MSEQDTPARAALRWPCGAGLGGMVGSALFSAFISSFRRLCRVNATSGIIYYIVPISGEQLVRVDAHPKHLQWKRSLER